MSDENTKAAETPDSAASALSAGLGARPVNCDQVAWMLNAIERYLPPTQHPRVSRSREMQKYALLYELMEVAHLYFEDASAQHNGTPGDVRRFQYASKQAEAAAHQGMSIETSHTFRGWEASCRQAWDAGAATEREQCAVFCEDMQNRIVTGGHHGAYWKRLATPKDCAEKLRARSNV